MEMTKQYRMAAECGHVEAQYRLGECFMNGWGIEDNPQEAAVWFKEAADQEHPVADEQCTIAVKQIPLWITTGNSLTESFRTTLSQPWKWSV